MWTFETNSIVSTKSLEYFGNHISLELIGNEVYFIAYHLQGYSFCFTMLPHFVTIASFRTEILTLGCGRVRRKWTKSGLNNTKGIGRNTPFSQQHASQMIFPINTTVDCSVEATFDKFPSWRHHFINAISQLYNLLLLWIR